MMLRSFGLGAGLLLLLAQTAFATPFTLASTVSLDGTLAHNFVLGEIRPVTNFTGTVLLSDGTIDFTNDFFVVEIELFSGSASVDQIQFTVVSSPFVGNPVGVGAFDDGVSRQAPDNVVAESGDAEARYDFDFNGVSTGNLEAGDTSTRLFAIYEASGGGPGALSAGNSVTFMISAGTNFNVSGTIVPEPGTAALVGSGLVGLGLAGRRRRSG